MTGLLFALLALVTCGLSIVSAAQEMAEPHKKPRVSMAFILVAMIFFLVAVARAQCEAAPCNSCTTAQRANDLTCTNCVSPSEIQGPIPCSKLDPLACQASTPTTTPTSSTTPATLPSQTDTLNAKRLNLLQQLATPGAAIDVRTVAEVLMQVLTNGTITNASLQLARNQAAELGRIYESGAGDGLECIRAGTTAAVAPLGIPILRHPDLDVRAGQRVYFGWGGAVWNSGWATANGNCTTSLKRDHHPCGGLGCIQPCQTIGCQFSDGSCMFTMQSLTGTYADVVDGTATFRLKYFSPTGGGHSIRMGRTRMGDALHDLRYGDNDGATLLLGDGYSTSTGPMREAGSFTMFAGAPDPRWGLPNLAVGSTKETWQTAPGFRAYSPQQGWPPDARPIVNLVSGGTDPANTCAVFAAMFLETQGGGRSILGPTRRVCTVTAGQRFQVSYPQDELAYQQKAPWGGVYLPVICRGGGFDSNAFYLNRVDILQAADESVTIAGSYWPETETCSTSVSTMGLPLFDVRDATNSAPAWRANEAVGRGTVYEKILPDGLCRSYRVWGVRYDSQCRNGETGLFSGFTGPTEPAWRMDWQRFCDSAGTAYQLNGYCDSTLIVTTPVGVKGISFVQPTVNGLQRVGAVP